MERTLTPYIRHDLENKIVLITGPRQVGKTTLAKSLFSDYDYFNYDSATHRIALKEQSWDRNKPVVIFDELHKMSQWKRWLKGIYDTEGVRPRLLVTGSAKLNTYRKVGDSLAGRYFQYRLHPLDLKETKKNYSEQEAFERLWHCSGFPEPFLKGDQNFYNRWRRSHTDIILRQDLLDIQHIRDIQTIETLITLLQRNVGSPVSYANLARTLEKDAKTIKRWLQLLEDLYIIFKVTPYFKKVARSLLKEPKYYFYDFVKVIDNDGAKLENIVACALFKELHFIEDIYGMSGELHFLRTKDGREIDFLVLIENKPSLMIEIKSNDVTPNSNFAYFDRYLKNVKKIQLVKEIKREKTYPDGLEIRSLVPWLANIELTVERNPS
jgi:predicted AAA+ superfamily ATPase